MNIHIDLADPTKCDGCPLLDKPTLWQGKPTGDPKCAMGYGPRWEKVNTTEALISTQRYVVMRAQFCIEDNGE